MFTQLLGFAEGAAEGAVEAIQIAWGAPLACLAAAFAFIPAAIGSAVALSKTGQTMAGIVAEKPEVYSKLQLVQLLPATQGLYGFLIGFLILVKIGLIGSGLAVISTEIGLQMLFGALPVGFLGLFSAIRQGAMGCSAMELIGKNPDMSGKGVLMTAVIELYAIFGFIVSFFVVFIGVTL